MPPTTTHPADTTLALTVEEARNQSFLFSHKAQNLISSVPLCSPSPPSLWMLCEDCSPYLGIAEAIRSLGLMILKGETEACGKKTLMCFMVEGQNNRSMHCMDILGPLV